MCVKRKKSANTLCIYLLYLSDMAIYGHFIFKTVKQTHLHVCVVNTKMPQVSRQEVM